MSSALYELRDAGITGESTVLRAADWTVRDRCVTAIVGPAATGKSVLLATLAARTPPGFQRVGTWLSRGAPLDARGLETTLVPQRTHRDLLSDAFARESALLGPGTLLIDEPESHTPPSERARISAAIRERLPEPTVFVSHDLDLVRSTADRVMLLCAGSIVVDTDTTTFFERPTNELVARFVREGNCWPGPASAALPSSFNWILPGRLAGMAKPGLLREADEDLAAIVHAGIGLLVSLTEEPFPASRLQAFGLEGAHLPIRDMDVPALGRAADLCRRIDRAIQAGTGVAVHCHAGLGRTGTLLAAYLVWKGDDAITALARVRAVESRMVQTSAQARFVVAFAETFGPPS